MEFIESPRFLSMVGRYLDDDEYHALQMVLGLWPERGTVIPGSGGIRKLRWGGKGKGKRGGLRIIYYWKSRDGKVWLLEIYAKNEMENIPLNKIIAIRKEMGL